MNARPSPPGHLAGLDVLRVLAILLVILWHYPHAGAPPLLDALVPVGWTGVELFFVLSGFLIGGQVLAPLAQGQTLPVGRFYLRRALRILPAFGVVLALYLWVPGWRERELLTPAWRFLTFTQNFGLRLNAFSHAWSLCVEEHFYLVLPALVLALRRVRGTRVLVGMAGVMVLGALLRGALWLHLFADAGPEDPAWRGYDTWLYYPTYARLDGLVCGLMLAGVRVFRPGLWERVARRPGAPLVGAALCLALATGLCLDRTSLRSTVLVFPLLSLGYAGLLWAMAGPAVSRVCARLPGVRTLSALTFCLYLTHKMVIHAVVGDFMAERGHAPFALLTLGVCVPAMLVAAWVLHRAVERPMVQWRERLERTPRIEEVPAGVTG